LLSSLPDANVYGQEDLKLPVDQRTSLLWTIDDMYGEQFDATLYENLLTANDNYITSCRDEFLYQNFGIQFGFPKPVSMQYVDYRFILMQLIAASLVGSTNQAASDVAIGFTGVAPTITLIRDFGDFFLNTILDPPITSVAGQTVYYTSDPYISGSITVVNNSTGLIVSSSSYTTDPVQGTWTMNTPQSSGTILQAEFDIGETGDPVPLVFDSTDNTMLTGTLLFTNGSTGVVGFGSNFTGQLVSGNEITDLDGVYLGIVQSVSDSAHLILESPWVGPSEETAAYRLQYTDQQLPPPIVWDEGTLAWGVLITINNPGQFVLS
jgi:hypothetical protein